MEADLKDPMSIRHKMTVGDFSHSVLDIQCTCRGEFQPAAYKMYETNEEHNAIVWNNCARTLFASFKRHLMAVPLPEFKAVQRFMQFATDVIETELGTHLDQFDYSYSQWFNHLNGKQQAELVNVEPTNRACIYDMFCKREVQLYEVNESLPKTRAIAGPQPEDKFVLGPVTWALEHLMAEKLEGYCGGKNWEELEATLKVNYDDGYTVLVQGDGSGFDRTQSHELKAVDRLIYNRVASKIYHVSPDIFVTKATSRYRKLRGYTFDQSGKRKILEATVDATVTSGNPDTTLMNTVRMSLYIRFMAKEAGVKARFLAKGDDFAIFCKSYEDANKINEQIEKYWAPKNKYLNEIYGLGLVIKFVKIGGFETFDFCSTNLICDFTTSQFKIVRQWKRIINQGQYSIKALALSTQEKSNYMNDLAVGMSKWDADMPFYRDYRQQILSKYPDKYQIPVKVGKPRVILPDDGHAMRKDENPGASYDQIKDQLRASGLKIDDPNVIAYFVENIEEIEYSKPWTIL